MVMQIICFIFKNLLFKKSKKEIQPTPRAFDEGGGDLSPPSASLWLANGGLLGPPSTATRVAVNGGPEVRRQQYTLFLVIAYYYYEDRKPPRLSIHTIRDILNEK